MKILIFLFVILSFVSFLITPAIAQSPTPQASTPAQNYYKAEVTQIINSEINETDEFGNFTQTIEIEFLDGPMKGEKAQAENSGSVKFIDQKSVDVGNKVVILETSQTENINYTVWDKYRLNYIFFLIIGFFTLIIIFAGLKGVGSIIGMITSLLILVGFIVPQILKGHDPLLVTIAGSCVILFITIFLAHGVSKKTTSAVISTVISLTLTGILAFIFVKMISLTGLGDENNYMLHIGNLNLNAQGLLLSGIIIGSLGVLDDVTTTQSAAIFEFFKLNKKLSITDLFTKGYTVGKEHISSLVNTLILAYAGASLGLFVIIVLNPNNTPLWVILNSEMIVEEIVRAVSGSIGLILAVPITTIIAAYIAKRSLT